MISLNKITETVNFNLYCIYARGGRLMGRIIRKNFVGGVTMARVYVADKKYIY